MPCGRRTRRSAATWLGGTSKAPQKGGPEANFEPLIITK